MVGYSGFEHPTGRLSIFAHGMTLCSRLEPRFPFTVKWSNWLVLYHIFRPHAAPL